MHNVVKSSALLLALLWVPMAAMASHKKPKPLPQGRLVRVIPVRITMYYSLKDKKTGTLTHLSMVSKTVKVKVVKPVKPIKRK